MSIAQTKEDHMRNRRVLFAAMIMSVCLFMLWGCPKKSDVTSEEPQKETAAAGEKAGQEKAVVKEGPTEKAGAAAKGLQPIYFDFDKSFVRNDAKAVMKANAEWLKANPTVNIKIEGNCDDRGTKEYNQALGQRRAAAAKKYLTDLGIAAKRISLISYGKEKLSCTEATETCWQKNRRDDFVAAK
jgi:peptidoglycan-associated lipoprotein